MQITILIHNQVGVVSIHQYMAIISKQLALIMEFKHNIVLKRDGLKFIKPDRMKICYIFHENSGTFLYDIVAKVSH